MDVFVACTYLDSVWKARVGVSCRQVDSVFFLHDHDDNSNAIVCCITIAIASGAHSELELFAIRRQGFGSVTSVNAR